MSTSQHLTQIMESDVVIIIVIIIIIIINVIVVVIIIIIIYLLSLKLAEMQKRFSVN